MRHLRAPILAATALVLAGCGDDPSALRPRGRGAREIADLWWVLFWPGVAVMVLVTVVLLRSGRRREESTATPTEDADAERSGRRWVLAGGVLLPLIVILPISFLTLQTGSSLSSGAGDDALEIELVGQQFWWEVRYPGTGATTANEIHLPVGRDARITMTSRDVIHSFWVPSLHGKVDLNPGATTEIVLDADEPGTYQALCAEFCGIQHAHMKLLVIAHPEDEFGEWLERESSDAVTPTSDGARTGADVFDDVGCASCHTVRGTDADGTAGPDLTHIASRRTLGAATIENNRGNLGGWIADPQAIKPGNKMPPSVLDGDELIALIAYLEALE